MAIGLNTPRGNGAEGVRELILTNVDTTGAQTYLCVVVGFNNNDNQNVQEVHVDYGGVSEMALAYIPGTRVAMEDDSQTEIWGVKNPPAGNFSVRVYLQETVRSGEAFMACAFPLTGVDQDNPVYDVSVESGTGEAHVTVDCLDDQMVLGVAFCEDRTVRTDTGTIEDYYYNPADGVCSGRKAGVTSSVTLDWQHTSDKHACSGVSFAVGVTDQTLIPGGIASLEAFGTPALGKEISGVTKNSSGSVLGSCHTFLCRDNGDNTCDYIAYVLSDAGTGAYSFIAPLGSDYFVLAWKDDSPHVFDVTDHVL